MTNAFTRAAAVLLLAGVCACQPSTSENEAATARDSSEAAPPKEIAANRDAETQPFAAITAGETIYLVGTEPFWGGTVSDGKMTYSTMEDQQGEAIAVKRFAGNGGLGFSGVLQGQPLDLTITQGACSDGMSDRTFPFTVTLRLGEEQRSGCAWTERRPFTDSAAP